MLSSSLLSYFLRSQVLIFYENWPSNQMFWLKILCLASSQITAWIMNLWKMMLHTSFIVQYQVSYKRISDCNQYKYFHTNFHLTDLRWSFLPIFLGFGQDGPYKDRAGYDVIAASIGGLMHITGPKVSCQKLLIVSDIPRISIY